jgi:hypothetical protein
MYFCPMKKSKDNLPASTEHTSKVHHPHDKFVRALLQEKAFTVQLLEYVLPAEVFNTLDISSLKITTNTYIDPELIGSYSDVCYEGITIHNRPLRISLIFEHKSDNPGVAIYDQLARYIVDGWSEDRRQGRTLTLSIPVLIHHGDTPVTLQTPVHVFPDAPAHLLPYVPAFKYDIIDVAAMSVETILALKFWTLRNTLLALKIGRDEKKVAQYLRELLIFASGDKDSPAYAHLVELTLIYLSNISKNAHMAIANIETILTPEEQEQIPSIFGKYFVKGREEGIDIGIEKGTLRAIQHYIKKNPTATDQFIAELFEVNLDLVHKARHSDPV